MTLGINCTWFRASMLMLLCKGPFSARVKDDQPDDKVFEVAQFPTKKMKPGVAQGPPLVLISHRCAETLACSVPSLRRRAEQ
jgi:hypothetical protein